MEIRGCSFILVIEQQVPLMARSECSASSILLLQPRTCITIKASLLKPRHPSSFIFLPCDKQKCVHILVSEPPSSTTVPLRFKYLILRGQVISLVLCTLSVIIWVLDNPFLHCGSYLRSDLCFFWGR